MSRSRLAALLAAAVLAGGCAATAPRYSAHVSNTLALRAAALDKVNVGSVRADPAADDDFETLRAHGMHVASPYGSYTEYLREALRAELDHAGMLDESSPLRIDAMLSHNALRSGGAGEYSDVGATLTVTRGGAVLWSGAKRVRHEWRAQFVADPNVSIGNYRVGVQRLIAAFIADPGFVAALARPAP